MHKRVIVSLLAASLTALLAGPAMAAAPKTVVLEGLLTSSGGGVAADGIYDMTFSVYAAKSGGSALWAESAKVAAKGGQFHHALGSVKALDAGKIAALKSQWIGLKVGTDPEMPRQPLHSAMFALYAGWAGNVKCSGCINSGQIANGSLKASDVGFTYAGSKTKGGPAISASDLKCTGCVSVAEMKWDANVDLGTRSLKAAAVAAGSFIGDGSKLTGIKHVSGECKNAGEVVKGINPDGSLKCVKALDPNNLPKDGLDEISNGQLSTQFTDTIKGGAGKALPDNSPQGLVDSIKFPDIGIAQDIKINVDISNSDTGDVVVYLFPPKTPNLPSNRAALIDSNHKIKDAKTYPHYTLHYKKQFDPKNKTIIKTSFPKPTKEISGDIHKDHLNTNIKGEWRLWIIDTAFLNNKTDGKLNGWNIEIKTLSSKQVESKGTMFVGGKLWGKYQGSGKPGATLEVGGGLRVGSSATCNTAAKGTLRWVNGEGLQVCTGTEWSTALAKPIIFQGGCNNSNPGGDTWRYRCLNHVSINTRPDVFKTDGNSGSYSSSHSHGRVYVHKTGWYKMAVQNYGHMCYMCLELRIRGSTIRHICNYHDNNRPRTLDLDAVAYVKAGDWINVRVYCNCCSHIWHRTTYGYNGVNYSGHNWLYLEYIGPKSNY